MEIIMPKMGDAMSEGKVIRWYKQPGDPVKKGEAVAEIETDKVNLDLEAEGSGTLGEHAAKEGEVVQVGGLLANILGEGEKDAPREEKAAPEPAPEKKEEPAGDPQQRRSTDKKDSVKHTTGEYHEAIEQKGPRRDRTAPESESNVVPMDAEGGRRRSSPLARKMASEMGVSLANVQGSGPRGRIVAADVMCARGGRRAGTRNWSAGVCASNLAAPLLETKIIPLTAMRR